MNRLGSDRVLTTTRSVRRRLDLRRAVDSRIIQECIDIALQAPNGGNRGRYRFLVVADSAKRARVAEFYRKAWDDFLIPARNTYSPGVFASAAYLADHLHEVPIHVIPCVEGRVENEGLFGQATRYGSILPATCSLMLALRHAWSGVGLDNAAPDI
jgi:nitroreductase